MAFRSVAAAGLGVMVGLISKSYALLEKKHLEGYVNLPVDVLEQMVRGLSAPLFVSSMVVGVCAFRTAPSTKIAVRAAVYCMVTTLMSVLTGLILLAFIKPGFSEDVMEMEADDRKKFIDLPNIVVLMRNLFPDLGVKTLLQHYEKLETGSRNLASEAEVSHLEFKGKYVFGANFLGLFIISVVFGLTFNKVEEKTMGLLQVTCAIKKICVKFFGTIHSFLPVGILVLALKHVVSANERQTALDMLKFTGVVVTGLSVHGAIVLPLLYFAFARCNPWTIIGGVHPALGTALFLSSSAATLPVTMRCFMENNNIHSKIANFMLPLCSHINVNGSALYWAVAAGFVAQMNNVHLDFSMFFSLWVITAAFSFISRGLPACGALMPLLLLMTLNLPFEDAWILVTVEWMLDRFNTAVNILGNCLGAALVQKLSEEELIEMDRIQKSKRGEAYEDAREQEMPDTSPFF